MKIPILSAFACLASLFLASAPGAMANVTTQPLELASDFVPALTFSETHTDSLRKTVDPLDKTNVSYDVVSAHATTANITANIKGIVLTDIDTTTAFALNFGTAQIAFTLGDIPTYHKPLTTAFYCWNGWDTNNKPLGKGGVTLTWTATKLTVTVTMGDETTRPSPIGTDAFVGAGTDPGTFPIKDTLTADLSFGTITTSVPRTVYVTGTYKVTHATSGSLYDFYLYTITEAGAADYARPTVALTSPSQGASVGAAVDVNGTAADAKGLIGVEWTTDLNAPWTTTDQFSLSAAPLDGLWGTTSAIWTVSLASLPHGTTHLWVRSIDDSGNTATPLLITLINPVPVVLTGRWDALLVPAMVNGLRGAIHFTFSANGSYTGTLVQEGASFGFTGSLLADETLSVSISRGTAQPPLVLSGTIASFAPVGESTAGIAGDLKLTGTSVATFNAFRSPWSTLKLADPTLAGNFHVKIDPAAAPIGNGYALVATARTGVASAAFTLADGSVVTWSGVMGASGQLPVFASLYVTTVRGVVTTKGSVSAPMAVNGAARTIDTTTLTWVRPPSFGDKQFPSGFSYNLDASGIAYTAPSPATVRVMALASTTLNATASWSGDDVPTPLSLAFTVNASNTLTIPVTTDALKLALVPSNGTWTGSFKMPGTAVLSTCKLLIVGTQAYGFWAAPALTGSTVKRFGLIHVQ